MADEQEGPTGLLVCRWNCRIPFTLKRTQLTQLTPMNTTTPTTTTAPATATLATTAATATTATTATTNKNTMNPSLGPTIGLWPFRSDAFFVELRLRSGRASRRAHGTQARHG